MFRVLDVLTVTWATGDLPEESDALEEKEPTTKLFDDDERVRSLTEAQAVTADIPEERNNAPNML